MSRRDWFGDEVSYDRDLLIQRNVLTSMKKHGVWNDQLEQEYQELKLIQKLQDTKNE